MDHMIWSVCYFGMIPMKRSVKNLCLILLLSAEIFEFCHSFLNNSKQSSDINNFG